jgi:hypothetical protein
MAKAASGTALMTATQVKAERERAQEIEARKAFDGLDWDEWIKGGVWVAERGDDFQCETKEFRAEVMRRADLVDLCVEVEVKGPRVYFEFSEDLG